jgi:hypothetical protein
VEGDLEGFPIFLVQSGERRSVVSSVGCGVLIRDVCCSDLPMQITRIRGTAVLVCGSEISVAVAVVSWESLVLLAGDSSIWRVSARLGS